MGGSHLGTDFSNQGGTIAQMERGSPWPPVSRENTGGPPPPGPLPLGAGQMPLGNQPPRVAPVSHLYLHFQILDDLDLGS